MDFIDTPPTLEDFYSDMNKHPTTAYRMKDDHVIEVELHRSHPNPNVDSDNRGSIRIWKAQTHDGQYVPGDGSQSQYKWYTVASGWKSFDEYVTDRSNLMEHAEELAALLAESDMHFDDFVTNYAGGVAEPRDIPATN